MWGVGRDGGLAVVVCLFSLGPGSTSFHFRSVDDDYSHARTHPPIQPFHTHGIPPPPPHNTMQCHHTTTQEELEKFLKTSEAAAAGAKDALPAEEDYAQHKLDAGSHLGMQMLKQQGWEEGRGLGKEGAEGAAAPVNRHAPAGEAAGCVSVCVCVCARMCVHVWVWQCECGSVSVWIPPPPSTCLSHSQHPHHQQQQLPKINNTASACRPHTRWRRGTTPSTSTGSA